MGYATIKAQIKSIIQTNITTANVVYDYAEKNPTGYPAITIESYDGEGEFIDTGRNKRKYIFRILVMQERLNVSPSEAERITQALVDQLITIFDDRTNITLNNTVIFAMPIPSKWGYIQAPDVDIRTAEVLLEATTVS